MHGLFYISTFNNPFRLTVSDINHFENNKGDSTSNSVDIKFSLTWTTDKTVDVPVKIYYRRKIGER